MPSTNTQQRRWVLALGGNVADPARAIDLGWRACVAALRLRDPVLSPIHWSAPAEAARGPAFANAVGLGWTSTDARDGLDLLHAIERAFGRDRLREGFHGARPLDLDIVDVAGVCLQSADLLLPHPRWHLRPFVWMPLAELDPTFLDATGRALPVLAPAVR